VLSVSDRWLSFMGHASRDDVLGRGIAEFMTEDSRRDHVGRNLPALMDVGFLDDLPYRFVKRSGELADVLVSARVSRDEKGRVTRTMAAVVDVTDRLRAEAELERTQEALRQSHKMEAIGQLTGGVAHDFNNLLQAIGGSLEMVERRLAAGRTDVAPFSRAARASVERAATLTQRLLAFSRRQPLRPAALDLNELVAGMAELVRRSVGEAVAVETRLAEGLWRGWADANQVENALLNLAINARDAMPAGGRLGIDTANVHLAAEDLRAEPEAEPGDYVRLAVTDTGAGMAPEVLARAFEPFFTTKPVGQGTGLGLSQLYGFARQSGGHARIRSEVGRGTAVEIFLPRHRGAEAPGPTPAAAPEPAPRGEGRTVLLVEDEALIAMVLAETLDGQGYRVLQAGDGPSALGILEGPAPIDLLVTDVGLPGMDGRRLAEAARLLRPGLRVLFLTGYAHDARRGDLALGPGTDLLAKPVAMDDFAKKVRAMAAGP
jgi:PAS domain S-box-containing protein